MESGENMAEYPLRSDSKVGTAERMANLVEAWYESGVTKAVWADAIGVSSRTLGRWLNDWTGDGDAWRDAATNRMDASQVSATCSLFNDVSVVSLKLGGVPQPKIHPIWNPTDAEPDRYTPETVSRAYGKLSKESQRKVTAYIADLLDLEQTAASLAQAEDQMDRVLIESSQLLYMLCDRGSLSEDEFTDEERGRLRNYVDLCERYLEEADYHRHVDERIKEEHDQYIDIFMASFEHFHRLAAHRGKPKGAKRQEKTSNCEGDVNP